MIQEIKFKKKFTKLHNQEYCYLLEVKKVFGWELLNKSFMDYDTDNDNSFKINREDYYLLLFCVGDLYIPFTTVRKFNDENILKYCTPSISGKEFKIVIE